MENDVLVLNANFQPIQICSTRRAVNLVFANKATLVMNGRGYIHSVTNAFPRPSIIRLERMVIRPRLIVPLSRHEVFRRDSYTCQYCGRRNVDFTLDHVIPRKNGGSHNWENVVTACITCNHRKGSHSLREANMQLLSRPTPPPASAAYYFQSSINRNSEWVEFIKGW